MSDQKKQPKKEVERTLRRDSDQAWWQPALVVGLQISGWILGPLLIALFLGKWLDNRYNSSPKFLLICVGVAFVVSNIGMIVNTIKTAKDFKKLPPVKPEEEKDGNKPETTT